MTDLKLWISDSVDKYKSFETIFEDAKYVNPCDPTSIAKAKAILRDLELDLISKFEEKNTTEILAVRALLKWRIGYMEANDDECESGFANFLQSWELIKDESCDPQCSMLALEILNHLSTFLINRKEHAEKALSYLKTAECLYHDYKRNSSVFPKDVADIFSVNPDEAKGWKPFEVAHTSTLFYLAKVYDLLGEFENTTKYYELFLRRHQDFVELNPKEWLLLIGDLSRFYVGQQDYVTARHLLSCASYVFSTIEASSDNNEQVKIHLSYIKAEISLYWTNYCHNLLTSIVRKDLQPKIRPRPPRLYADPEVMAFEVEAPLVVTTFSEARNAFLFTQQHVKQAESIHTFSKHPQNYVNLQVCHSMVYKFLIRFENDLGRMSKMFKRRADILENVLSKITFLAPEWHELQYELAWGYYAMVRAKLENYIDDSKPYVSDKERELLIKKIKSLVRKSITGFERLLEVLKDSHGAFPEKFPDDVARFALMAHHCLSKLYQKITCFDTNDSDRLANHERIKKYHNFILDYVKKNPDHYCHIEKRLRDIEGVDVYLAGVQLTGTLAISGPKSVAQGCPGEE